ncbi:hypothetical protein I656_02545 [Geobacillus sp. WSUCF1]|nr:hypothetical protein I656_02545 [Geobacillus sp. WSUCF1]
MDGNSGSNVMIEPCRLEGVLKRLGRLFALANIGIKQQMELKPFSRTRDCFLRMGRH